MGRKINVPPNAEEPNQFDLNHYLQILCTIYWICALIAYSLKLVWKQYDRFTSYGKLRPASDRTKGILPVKFAWISFYLTGLIFNTGLLALYFLMYYRTSKSDEFMQFRKQIPKMSKEDEHAILMSVLQSIVFSAHKTLPVMSVLMQLQLIRRLLECITVHQYSPTEKMRLFNWASGLSFYIFACLTIFTHELSIMMVDQSPLYLSKALQLIGVLLFGYASYHQHLCHGILARIRHSQKKYDDSFDAEATRSSPQESRAAQEQHASSVLASKQRRRLGSEAETEARSREGTATTTTPDTQKIYRIPRGDWFEFSSCPHYFAEMLIYGSFVICASFASINCWLMALFVVYNLGVNGRQTHQWYREKFRNYPPERRAVIVMPRRA